MFVFVDDMMLLLSLLFFVQLTLSPRICLSVGLSVLPFGQVCVKSCHVLCV